jgi:endonuclease YncB( thermonuclease family)
MNKKTLFTKLFKTIKKRPLIAFPIIMALFIMYVLEKEGGPKGLFEPTVTSLISNKVRVVDGDTIVLDGIKIRLKGIDAPESKQECISYSGAKKRTQIPCGEMATTELKAIIGKNKINCSNEGKDIYNRQLSYCYVGGLNINEEMVRRGYAVAAVKYDKSFKLDEKIAKSTKEGLWAGEFEDPEKWRRKKSANEKNNQIKG